MTYFKSMQLLKIFAMRKLVIEIVFVQVKTIADGSQVLFGQKNE